MKYVGLHVQDRRDQGQAASRGRTCSSRTRTTCRGADAAPAPRRCARPCALSTSPRFAPRTRGSRLSVHRTPVLTCASLDARGRRGLCLSSARTCRRSARSRRAARAMPCYSLSDEEARRGVVTHSVRQSRRSARLCGGDARGIPAWVVMPRMRGRSSRKTVRRFGATVASDAHRRRGARGRLCGRAARNRRGTRAPLRRLRGSSRGRARRRSSCSKRCRISTSSSRPSAAVACFRGRRSRSSSALDAGSGLRRRAGRMRDDAAQRASPPAGRAAADATTTIADGLRTSLARADASPRSARDVDHIATPRERGKAFVHAMRMTWERLKLVVETSAAVPLACLLDGPLAGARHARRRHPHGGNVDLDRLPWQRHVSATQRRHRCSTVRGVTLQYKTKDHLVTATYRVDFEVFRFRPLRAARSLGLRQVDAAEGGRRLHDAGRGRDPARRARSSAARDPTG